MMRYSGGRPLGAEAEKTEARVLHHLIQRERSDSAVALTDLVTELAGAGDVQVAVERLAGAGLVDVVGDQVQAAEQAFRFWQLSRYMPESRGGD